MEPIKLVGTAGGTIFGDPLLGPLVDNDEPSSSTRLVGGVNRIAVEKSSFNRP